MDSRCALIVNELRRLGPLSNQELARLLDLSPASITNTLQPMVQCGMLKERPPQDFAPAAGAADGDRKSRRKLTVTPNPDYGYALAVDLTGHRAQIHKLDFCLRPDPAFRPVMAEDDGPAGLLGQAARALAECRAADPRALLAVAVLREQQPRATTASRHWSAAVQAKLAQLSGVGTVDCSCHRALAQWERHLGGARDCDDFLILHVHDGAGICHYRGGMPPDNPRQRPGRWIVDPYGPRLDDAPPGCLEHYVDAAALAARLRRQGVAVQDHELYRVLETGADKAPVAAVREAMAQALAMVCVNLSCALAPERLFLSGPPAELGDGFLEAVRAAAASLGAEDPNGQGPGRLMRRGEWRQAALAGAALHAIGVRLDAGCAAPQAQYAAL